MIKRAFLIGIFIPIVWIILPLIGFPLSYIFSLGFDYFHVILIILFNIVISIILATLVGLFLERFGKIVSKSEKIVWLTWIVLIFNLIFIEYAYILIFFNLIFISAITYLIRNTKIKKQLKSSVLITYILLVTFLMGRNGIYPFGNHNFMPAGDVILISTRLSSLTSTLLSPLSYLGVSMEKLANMSITSDYTNFFLFILVIFYYLIISLILIYLFEFLEKFFKAIS